MDTKKNNSKGVRTLMDMIFVDKDDGKFDKFVFDVDVGTDPIGVDTETSGLDTFSVTWYLLQVSVDDTVYIFDVQKLGLPFMVKVVDVIQNCSRVKVLHNAKYDIKVIMTNVGILITNVHDTMWTETLIHLGVGEVLSSLATLVALYTGIVLDKKERVNFYENYTGITQELLTYSMLDVVYLVEIYNAQMKQIEDTNLSRVYVLESRLVPVVAMMEYNGVLLDVEKWTKMADENKVKLEEARIDLHRLLLDSIDYSKYESATKALEALRISNPISTKRARAVLDLITGKQEIKEIVHKEFNFGSHTQMLNLLQMLGAKIESTNEKILKEQAGKFEFIDRLLQFREWEKKESTYGCSFLEHINPKTGRIHTEFLNLGARTGRFSSGDSKGGKGKPNLQNIPRESEYRSCFIARPGRKLLAVDYSQQEYRFVGAVSNEPVIIQAYLDGIDMHTATAMIATGKKKEEITKDDRSHGKSLNFAIIYGSTEFGLAHNLKISIEKGKEILDNFYAGYPQLAAFKKAVEKIILQKKYSVTPYGRRRYFDPEPSFADAKELAKYRGKIMREGFNHIIQGGGADVTKLALVELFYRNPYGDKFQLLIQVHDEIVAEVADDIADEAKVWMEDIMKEVEQPFLGKIPAAVDGALGTFWVH